MPWAPFCLFAHYKEEGCPPTDSTNKPESQQQHLEASGDISLLKPWPSQFILHSRSVTERCHPFLTSVYDIPFPRFYVASEKKRKSKWNSNEFCFPALGLSFHTASQDPPRCYEALLSQAWEAHIPSQSKLPSSMKTLWAQLGVFTRCLNGVPTANVYLGIASPPGSRHLLTATGIGIAAPGKWAPLFPTFCMNRSVLWRSRACLRRLQTKQTGCFSCVGLFPGTGREPRSSPWAAVIFPLFLPCLFQII